MRALWLPDVLADEFRGSAGFRVDAMPGFADRGSPVFDPEGVMDHHTGPGAYNALLNFMAHTSSIAPLCNYSTSRPAVGVVRITCVASGRANHAGVGELPWRPGQGSTGNRRTVGGEHQNDGRQPWPAQQLEAMHRAAGAILRYLRRNESRRVSHKGYALPPGRKPDPHSLTDVSQRAAIARYLRAPAPPVPPSEEDDVLVNIEGGATAYRTIGSALVPYVSRDHAERDFGPAWRAKMQTLTADQAATYTVLGRDALAVLARLDQLVTPSGGGKVLSAQAIPFLAVNAKDALEDLGYKMSTTSRTGVDRG